MISVRNKMHFFIRITTTMAISPLTPGLEILHRGKIIWYLLSWYSKFFLKFERNIFFKRTMETTKLELCIAVTTCNQKRF